MLHVSPLLPSADLKYDNVSGMKFSRIVKWKFHFIRSCHLSSKCSAEGEAEVAAEAFEFFEDTTSCPSTPLSSSLSTPTFENGASFDRCGTSEPLDSRSISADSVYFTGLCTCFFLFQVQITMMYQKQIVWNHSARFWTVIVLWRLMSSRYPRWTNLISLLCGKHCTVFLKPTPNLTLCIMPYRV